MGSVTGNLGDSSRLFNQSRSPWQFHMLPGPVQSLAWRAESMNDALLWVVPGRAHLASRRRLAVPVDGLQVAAEVGEVGDDEPLSHGARYNVDVLGDKPAGKDGGALESGFSLIHSSNHSPIHSLTHSLTDSTSYWYTR